MDRPCSRAPTCVPGQVKARFKGYILQKPHLDLLKDLGYPSVCYSSGVRLRPPLTTHIPCQSHRQEGQHSTFTSAPDLTWPHEGNLPRSKSLTPAACCGPQLQAACSLALQNLYNVWFKDTTPAHRDSTT